MAEMKTKLNDTSVSDFLNKIADPQVREDCNTVMDIMKSAAGAEPRMWGSAIIGFGEYTMTYPNGRSIPWMVIGFSPRKQNLTLYVGSSFPEHDQLLAGLGKHSTGKGCLYIKRLSDVNIPTLEKMVNASVKHRLAENAVQKPSSARPGKKSVKPGKKKTLKKTVMRSKTTSRSTSAKASSRKSVTKASGKKKSRG
jgi:hypothetical protein